MDKKNNEGKTFGDIFSKVSEEEKLNEIKDEVLEDDNLGKTFNSIFDDNISNDSSKDVHENSVDNSDKKESFSDIFANIDKVDNKKDITDKKKSNSISFGGLVFDGGKDEKVSFSDMFDKVEDKNDDKELESNIFNGEEEKDTIKESKDDLNIFDNNDNSKQNNTTVNDNVFFNGNDKEDRDENKTEGLNIFNNNDNSKQSDTTVNDNVFFNGNDKEDRDENKTDDLNIFDNNDNSKQSDTTVNDNIFFNSNDKDRDENKTEDLNIFDNQDNSKQSDTNVNDNIFSNGDIDNEDSKVISSDISLEENISVNSGNEDNNDDKSADLDVSPFFEGVKTTDENPFFANKINLVEKQQFSNNDIDEKVDLTNVQNFDVKIRKKKPNLLQAVLGVLSYALFIWLLLIGVALLVYVLDIKIRAAKGDTSPPKYGAYVVLTGSMLPEIQVYDVVITKKQKAEDLKEGDVITFASSDSRFAGTIITHRIIKKNYSSKTKSYTFQTKGDNNNVADSALVTPNNIYGRVILKIPKLGYLRDFLASDGGWILVILFPCLAVVAYDVVKISKGLRKKKYKNLKSTK